MKKRIISITVFILIFAALSGLLLYLDNTIVTLTKISVTSDKLPESFNGFRIAQVSDLHNASFGADNKRLLNVLKESDPDIIVITGDIIDASRTDADIALAFVKDALNIAPVYYVTGNHEARAKMEYEKLKTQMTASGAVVLANGKTYIERQGETIALAGVNDMSFSSSSEKYTEQFASLIDDSNTYNILLAHRPEYFSLYSSCGFDIAFTGHAHGGQIRLPFIGGLFAPGQGVLPKYDAGLYTDGNFNMIVSRGLGNSVFPLRVNNFPEVILAVLN